MVKQRPTIDNAPSFEDGQIHKNQNVQHTRGTAYAKLLIGRSTPFGKAKPIGDAGILYETLEQNQPTLNLSTKESHP
eukprot:4099244-Amphidinium_carterae.1